MGAVVLDNERIRMALVMFQITQGELSRAAGYQQAGFARPARIPRELHRDGQPVAGGQEATVDADGCIADPRIGEAADLQPPPGLQRTSLVGQRTPADVASAEAENFS